MPVLHVESNLTDTFGTCDVIDIVVNENLTQSFSRFTLFFILKKKMIFTTRLLKGTASTRRIFVLRAILIKALIFPEIGRKI